MKNLEDFWKIAAGFGIPKLSDFLIDLDNSELRYNQTRTKSSSNWEQTTPEYQTFSVNINRVAVFLSDIKNIKPTLKKRKLNTSFKAKKIFFEHHIKSEAIFILLVTALEVYMESIFRIASTKFELKILNIKDLNKFCKTFHLKIEKTDKFLKDILADRMDFQNGDNCKIAFKLIDIDLPSINNALWQNIFDIKKEGSIMNIRHKIVHTGQKVMLIYQFSFEEVKEKVVELITFVSHVEKIRTKMNLQDRTIVTIFN